MAKLHIDTDLLRDLKILRALLAERCVLNASGCLIYPSAGIAARCQGYEHPIRVSPARIAWALENPHDHLSPHDFAVHLCEYAWVDDGTNSTVCCNANHIKKGTLEDVRVMTRARHFVLQGGR